MTDGYDCCPTCGHDIAIFVREDEDDEVFECGSCRTPLKLSWLNTENWTLAEECADVY